jgi:hypothetical protein
LQEVFGGDDEAAVACFKTAVLTFVLKELQESAKLKTQ